MTVKNNFKEYYMNTTIEIDTIASASGKVCSHFFMISPQTRLLFHIIQLSKCQDSGKPLLLFSHSSTTLDSKRRSVDERDNDPAATS